MNNHFNDLQKLLQIIKINQDYNTLQTLLGIINLQQTPPNLLNPGEINIKVKTPTNNNINDKYNLKDLIS